MLAKVYRLPVYLFPAIRKTGRKFESAYCFITISSHESLTSPQFGFIVSTKVCKKAVDRNRTKRLLREAVQQILPEIKANYGVVCVAKVCLNEVPLQNIITDLKQVLTKAQML